MKRNGNNRAMVVSKTQIPEGWRLVRLGDVLKLEYGVSLPERVRMDGNVPVIGSGGVVGFHSQAATDGPGIVVGRKGSIGSITWTVDDFVAIDTTYFVVPIDGKIDLRWAYYLLTREDLSRLNRATGIPGLNRDDVYTLTRLLPPLPEQRAIAAVLDSIDDAIERTAAVIAATEQLRDSLLHQLLTRGVPGWHTAWKEVPGLGTMPADWEMVRLGEVGEWYSGGTPSKSRPDYWSGSLPWVSPKDMKVRELRTLADYISEEGAVAGSRTVPPETVLVVVRGMILAKSFPLAITRVQCAFNQDMRALICGDGFDAEYVLSALEWRRPVLLNLPTPSTHGTMRVVSEDLYNVNIPVPSLQEQIAIRQIIAEAAAYEQQSRDALQKLRTLKESSADALLTGRVRMEGRNW